LTERVDNIALHVQVAGYDGMVGAALYISKSAAVVQKY